MKKIVILFLMLPLFGAAQNEVDALRYSQLLYGGTARSVSMGGAFGALGSDFSALSSNPAGMGVYRSSEFMFTPTFSYNTSSAAYFDGTLDDYKFRMNFSNIGLVATHNSGRDAGWKTTNFGIGYNRLADFNRYVKIEGKNDFNSMTDYFAALATGYKPGNFNMFAEGLAWDAYLIDPANSDTTAYMSALANRGQTQAKDINTKGGMGEYVFSLAGNYSDKLYIGGSLGIQSVRYVEYSEYTETASPDDTSGFKSFNYNNELKTTGAGFNFKFGVIFRPVDWVRLGGAVHTPTFFNLHDEYSSSIKSAFSDNFHGDGARIQSPSGFYDYELTTPFRAVGSLGFILGKIALVGMEYEYVDYSAARLRAEDYFFRTENNTIQTAYAATGNIKAGCEFRSGPLSIRAGYGFYGSPYVSSSANSKAIKTIYSAGFGIREESFYFDMAFVYSTVDEKYFLYDPSVINVSPANIKLSNYHLMSTFGFKF